ncbi:hypothetical protein ANABIO32_00960 [Rossellomorea marisflavi]|uniref:hypothetical protein n=1 Tax=Rossellomorea marisflavi TaxID=189381 RepID=UPI0025C96972|nr:hypothetical protein [Rossellomorea marisflavi]GLI82410.1 hypothetical protein ANABIO32_00960 [Rossellomorea marisflavi]
MKTVGFGEFSFFGSVTVDGGATDLQEKISDLNIKKVKVIMTDYDGVDHIVEVDDHNINLEEWETYKGKAAK